MQAFMIVKVQQNCKKPNFGHRYFYRSQNGRLEDVHDRIRAYFN